MADFTKSKDGCYRATIRVTHRVGRAALEASFVAFDHELPTSRAEALRRLREALALNGDIGLLEKAEARLPDLEDDFVRAELEEVRRRVDALFPELRGHPGLFDTLAD